MTCGATLWLIGETSTPKMATLKEQAALHQYLEGDYHDLKAAFRSHINGNPLFDLRFDLSLSEARAIAFRRAKFLWSTPQIKNQFDEQLTDPRNFIKKSLALGEVVTCTDMSVGVKAMVRFVLYSETIGDETVCDEAVRDKTLPDLTGWNFMGLPGMGLCETYRMGVMGWLFGGAVTNLGSEKHIEQWFQPLRNLEFTGMFCMSERGHGSNVRGIQTTAKYDPVKQEFDIHSPCLDAAKIYIGNAMMGNYAAVFAQLYIGDDCKGPHCFIVPIRDQDGKLYTGITTTDMGMKEGLHGVDNGLVQFYHVRIPRENLLNKFADVAVDGTYTTQIPSDGARFNTVLAALLGTRLALCFQALACSKIGLEIAIKYALKRRQFGPTGEQEQLLLDYQSHQTRLMPRLATCLGLIFATRHAGSIMAEDVHMGQPVAEDRLLQALAAGLKAYSTWEAVGTLQVCRECTGGMGYMEENRISSLKRDADVFVTFEGDNVVMLQQVTKELLVQYGQQFKGSKVKAVASNVKDIFMENLKTSIFAVSTDAVWTESFVMRALKFKEGMLLRHLAARLLNKVSSQNEPFLAWNDCLDHVLTLAWTHIYKVTLEQYSLAVSRCKDASTKAILGKFCHLYAVHLINTGKDWYLEQGYITPAMSKDIRDKYLELCAATSEHGLDVVRAFGHPANCVHAPIAGHASQRAPWAFYSDDLIHSRSKAKL